MRMSAEKGVRMPENNSTVESKKERDSKYELLRIIAMALITLNHAPVSGDALVINMYLRKLFFVGGKFGSYLFVIIGAWFLADSEKWSAKGIVKIVLQTVFYGVLFDLVCVIIDGGIGIRQFLSGFNYWFCFSYVFMLLVWPLLRRIPERGKIMITVAGALAGAGVTVLGYLRPEFILIKAVSKGIIIGPLSFCYAFIVVCELRRYWKELNAKIKPAGWFMIYLIGYLLMFLGLAAMEGSHIRDLQSPVCLLSAIGLFGFVSNLNVGFHERINRIAGCMFGMYLFQTHKLFSEVLWKKIFPSAAISEQTVFWFAGVFAVTIGVFAGTLLAEAIRRRIMKTGLGACINDKLTSMVDNIVRGIFKYP